MVFYYRIQVKFVIGSSILEGGLVVRHGITSGHSQRQFNSWTSKKYKLKHMSGYAGGDGYDELADIYISPELRRHSIDFTEACIFIHLAKS